MLEIKIQNLNNFSYIILLKDIENLNNIFKELPNYDKYSGNFEYLVKVYEAWLKIRKNLKVGQKKLNENITINSNEINNQNTLNRNNVLDDIKSQVNGIKTEQELRIIGQNVFRGFSDFLNINFNYKNLDDYNTNLHLIIKNFSQLNSFLKIIIYTQIIKEKDLLPYYKNQYLNNLKVQADWLEIDEERILFNMNIVESIQESIKKYIDNKKIFGNNRLQIEASKKFFPFNVEYINITKEFKINVPENFMIKNIYLSPPEYYIQFINSLFIKFRREKTFSSVSETCLRNSLIEKDIKFIDTKLGYQLKIDNLNSLKHRTNNLGNEIDILSSFMYQNFKNIFIESPKNKLKYSFNVDNNKSLNIMLEQYNEYMNKKAEFLSNQILFTEKKKVINALYIKLTDMKNDVPGEVDPKDVLVELNKTKDSLQLVQRKYGRIIDSANGSSDELIKRHISIICDNWVK